MKMSGVRERIEELKAEAADKCSLSREAYIKSLVEMYEAKPSEASMDNPRCDVVVGAWPERDPANDVLAFPDKIPNINRIAAKIWPEIRNCARVRIRF